MRHGRAPIGLDDPSGIMGKNRMNGSGSRPGRGLSRPGGPRPFFCSGMRIPIILWTKHRHTSVVTAIVTDRHPKEPDSRFRWSLLSVTLTASMARALASLRRCARTGAFPRQRRSRFQMVMGIRTCARTFSLHFAEKRRRPIPQPVGLGRERPARHFVPGQAMSTTRSKRTEPGERRPNSYSTIVSGL